MFDCVDEQTASKTFVFENQVTHQSTILDYPISIASDQVSIGLILKNQCPVADCQASIFNPRTCKFSPLLKNGSEYASVDQALLEPSIILIRFNKRASSTDDHSDDSRLFESEFRKMEEKDSKSRERTIQEVIEMVKEWRELHQRQAIGQKKRMNLQDAAKMVGISKKSLDDYYCQLRLAQLYNFDFQGNLYEKIGVLRTFTKNYRPSKQKKSKGNEKHPKRLRVIESYDSQHHCIRSLDEPVKVEHKRKPFVEQVKESKESLEVAQEIKIIDERPTDKKEDNISLVSLGMNESGGESMKIFDLEHDFFKDFDVEVNDEKDPYYDVELDFRRRDDDFDSFNSLLFD